MILIQLYEINIKYVSYVVMMEKYLCTKLIDMYLKFFIMEL